MCIRDRVVAINPLLKKQLAISSEFDEKSYLPLIDLILAEDYDKIVDVYKRQVFKYVMVSCHVCDY